MTLYNYVVNNCFTDCIKDFTSTSISDKEVCIFGRVKK